jgi:chromosome segregation ATPase
MRRLVEKQRTSDQVSQCVDAFRRRERIAGTDGRVDPHFTTAVSEAGGRKLDYIVVDTAEIGQACLAEVKASRASRAMFIMLSEAPAQRPRVLDGFQDTLVTPDLDLDTARTVPAASARSRSTGRSSTGRDDGRRRGPRPAPVGHKRRPRGGLPRRGPPLPRARRRRRGREGRARPRPARFGAAARRDRNAAREDRARFAEQAEAIAGDRARVAELEMYIGEQRQQQGELREAVEETAARIRAFEDKMRELSDTRTKPLRDEIRACTGALDDLCKRAGRCQAEAAASQRIIAKTENAIADNAALLVSTDQAIARVGESVHAGRAEKK